MSGRRRHLAGLLGALAAPRIALSQGGRTPRLAIFTPTDPDSDVAETGNNPLYRGFFPALRRGGYEEGRTLIVERWSANGVTARYPAIARDIVASRPDVIFAVTRFTAVALQAATSSIPIVAIAANPGVSGLVDSLARPGRNVTGAAVTFNSETWAKRLQLLREVVPSASRIALLAPRPYWDTSAVQLREIAPRLGVSLIGALLDDPIQAPEFRRVFAAMADQRVEAMICVDAAELGPFRSLVADLAAAYRLPLMAAFRSFSELGALMSYGTDSKELGRIVADYVVRVLRGDNPAEMPIRLMDKFEFVINLKTAKALGLAISPMLLGRADEVIE